MEKYFSTAKIVIISALLFLFPLFFLPITQEYYVTNKIYLLAFTGLLLILVSTLELLITKKLRWQRVFFDNLLLLFLVAIGISIVISSPNKIQAALDPSFGLVYLLALAVLYLYLSRSGPKSKNLFIQVLNFAGAALAIIAIVFYFQPFKSVNLPLPWQFLKNPVFTPLGTQLDLAIFLGFFVVYQIIKLLTEKPNAANKNRIMLNSAFLILNLLGLGLTVYSLLNAGLLLPPFSISWYAAVEILKNPITALFGVGVNNFSSMFTKVKDAAYNQSTLWQISSFSVSRSTFLHIFTETGVLGFLAFGLLTFSLIRQVFNKSLKNANLPLLALLGYLILVMVFFPPSLTIFFLFFVILGITAGGASEDTFREVETIDLSELIPIYLGTIIVSILLLAGAGYLLGRSYLAEYYFKQSLNGLAANSAKDIYNNLRQAVILDSYIERFHTNFAQFNLLLANNIASKGKKMTDQDRQTVSQAIQAAISEAKAAAALNPQNPVNWDNLALIYRNIINAAKGADVWTVSAYQRAIVLDPQNPSYRLNLGGVYYALQDYQDAISLFQQAVGLKPDWADAYYNLAWANYQKGDYQTAASVMQTVLTLINPGADKTDYNKAQADLTAFKKKIPGLNSPQPPTATVSPKLQLPKTASPEAK